MPETKECEKLDPDYTVLCPVLAALVKHEFLIPDESGRVNRTHLAQALHDGAGSSSEFSW